MNLYLKCFSVFGIGNNDETYKLMINEDEDEVMRLIQRGCVQN